MGGAERVLSDVASELAERGHDVSILTFDRAGGASLYPLHGKIRRLNLGLGDVREKSSFMETWKRICALRRLIRKEKPDAVAAFMHSMFVPMAFALIGTGTPVIASEHTSIEHYRSRKLEFLLLLASSFFASRVTVLSERIKSSYPRLVQERMTVISNPVGVPAAEADPGCEKSFPKVILNVGRLDPSKNQDILIGAFAKLAVRFPDWIVRIVGEGELRQDLEKLINDMGFGELIFLPGTIADISSEYQKAHIFAFPSAYESFGLAAAEAMAHGLPVVGLSGCAGINELIIDNENGFLAEGEDRAEAQSLALEKLMKSTALRAKMGEKAREAVKPLRPEIIVKKWEDIFMELDSRASQ